MMQPLFPWLAVEMLYTFPSLGILEEKGH